MSGNAPPSRISSPSTENTISPDCVDSTAASFFISFLTMSVALKKSHVAIIPENNATINDYMIWLLFGIPDLKSP